MKNNTLEVTVYRVPNTCAHRLNIRYISIRRVKASSGHYDVLPFRFRLFQKKPPKCNDGYSFSNEEPHCLKLNLPNLLHLGTL